LNLEGNYGTRVRSNSELKIEWFADGADKAQILQAQANPLIKGFTTNTSPDAGRWSEGPRGVRARNPGGGD
jgi:hypothetical protein